MNKLLRTILVVPALLYAGAQASAVAAELDSVSVEYATVAQEEVFNGIIEAVNESTVAAQTSGQVIEVLFDVDDHVPRGSVIVRLRDTEQRARLNKAESGLAEIEARHVQARNDYQREQKLFEQEAGSKSALEKAEALAGLEHASGYLRSLLARAAELRVTPELRFVVDRGLEHAQRIDEILTEIHRDESES